MGEGGRTTIALPIENLGTFAAGMRIELVAMGHTRTGTIASVEERDGMAVIEVESDLSAPSESSRFSVWTPAANEERRA